MRRQRYRGPQQDYWFHPECDCQCHTNKTMKHPWTLKQAMKSRDELNKFIEEEKKKEDAKKPPMKKKEPQISVQHALMFFLLLQPLVGMACFMMYLTYK